MLLLQVGDKPFRRRDDGEALARRGIRRVVVYTENDAIEHLRSTPYDIIFLDIDHPNLSGSDSLTALRRIRTQIPIFAFTKQTDIAFRVKVLDLGADDILTALCPIDELLARVRSVLRRLEGHPTSTLSFGPVEVLMDVRDVQVNKVTLRLTPREYRFVELLVRKRGAPVSKDSCLAYLYADREEPDAKAIDVLISRVRKKLASAGAGDIVKNVWGYGYKLEIDPPRESREIVARRTNDNLRVEAMTREISAARLSSH
jgi:DNA-binding response OmpR family regulator